MLRTGCAAARPKYMRTSASPLCCISIVIIGLTWDVGNEYQPSCFHDIAHFGR
jgi:hypothetical protein